MRTWRTFPCSVNSLDSNFVALFILSLNYFVHFSFDVLSRAFDYICMEKARYKFLIINYIIILFY